jgi:hypothetical protein
MKQSWRVVVITSPAKVVDNETREASYYISPVVHEDRSEALLEARQSVFLSGNHLALVMSTSLEFGCRLASITGVINTMYWSQSDLTEDQQHQIMSSVMGDLANTYKPAEFGL